MKTKTSIWMRRLTGLTTLCMLLTASVGNASAAILFQDDTVGEWQSDSLNIGSNDAGAVNTSIQFGADVTGTENGVINWNITTNTFEVDHTVSITGGVSATGNANFSGASEFHIRQVADEATAVCTTVKEIVLDTTENKIYTCTVTGNPGTWVSTSPSASDFEAIYGTDAGQNLNTSNGIFTITTGTNDFVVDSNDWNVTGAGALDAASITSNGALTATGTTSLNGIANIGDGGDAVSIDSSSWDISSAGVASGLTGITSTGTINFSGAGAFRIREDADPATNAACATVGELILDTTDNQIQVCTVTGTPGTWANTADGGNAGTLDGIDSTSFLRSDTSDNFTSGTLTLDSGTTLTVNGIANIGDNGDTVTINSSDWDVSATGAMTGISGITNDSTFTTSGGAVNVNASSNFATNINTGTSTGAVSIGGGSGTVAVDSSTWDISSAGAASGLTTIDASGNITTSAGTFCVGTTCLNETTSATDSGAFIVGVFDEFTNSNSTTVQGVLNDLDALIGSNAPNTEVLKFYPEYPDAVIYPDTTNNSGTLSSLYDNTNQEHYYHWTSNNPTLQDMDVKFRFSLPADFVSTNDFTFRYRTGSAVNTNNKVDITVTDATDVATCGSSTANVNAGAWATGTILAATLNAGCAGLSAGDVIEVGVKFYDNSGGADYADVGYLDLSYNN